MSRLSQLQALELQIAATKRFQTSGEVADSETASKLAQITGIEIGPQEEIITALRSSYIKEVSTENTSDGSMVDVIELLDGRVLALNYESTLLYASRDAYENQSEEITSMWLGHSTQVDTCTDK